MGAAQSNPGSVLIVTTQRDDRRVLFDALDAQNFEAVYTAKDLPQALSFLKQDPQIDVVVMEFLGEAREAVAFCTQLKGDPRLAQVPVIGIAAADAAQRQWDWSRAPVGVVEWLRSPVDASETLARVRQVLAPHAAGATGDGKATGDRYRFAFEDSLDEIVLSDPKTGAVIDANATFEQRSGFSRGQVIGQPLDTLDAGRDRNQRAALLATLVREGSVQYRLDRRGGDGRARALEAHMRLAVQGGRLVHVTVFREPAGSADDARYQAALGLITAVAECGGGDEGMNQVVKLLRDWLDPDFVMLVSARPEEDADAQPLMTWFRSSLPAEAPDPLKQPTLQRVLGGDGVFHGGQARTILAQDPFVEFFRFEAVIGLPLRDERRNTLGALMIARREALVADALLTDTLRAVAARLALELELRRAREQGRAKGLQDALTMLPNRLLFNDRLETTIKEAHRTGEMFAVLFVDLDRFKSINDSLGHGVGDEVLIAVAKRLRGSVRASDTVARYAGDEFTMILRHIVQRDDVMRIAEKIVRVMEVPLTLGDGSELHITASIGVSFYPDDAANAERLLKHADVAMYSAKGMGRNNFQTYVAVPEESHQQRLALESKLRLAEKNGELRVYYQPQVNTESEDICGMEALIRWEHPELGMISPGFFIPLAEENGLIVSIGEWVLRTACADARRWQDRFALNLRVSVNLSAVQLRQHNLLDVVAQALRDSGLEPTQLDLEVTESVNVKNIPNLLETLQGLRDLGCHIAIDDFGTGQSSLDYIKRFPADRIKIDQTFVRNIGVDPDDEAIVRATIGMAHNLGRGVVAEGVEIEQHLEFLRGEGCEELQGYLFCRPLPAASFENLLAERERVFQNAHAEAATVE
ncbi:MAG: EAL domain-containing protein [Proteobacteria bacterium]|nr:EAL domain-containing protein [Pseudomonadota bacterium]